MEDLEDAGLHLIVGGVVLRCALNTRFRRATPQGSVLLGHATASDVG